MRLIFPRTLADVEAELAAIGVAPEARAIVAPKALGIVARVDGISRNGANILKQEMLARGGDVAVPPEVALGGSQRTSVLLIGTRRQVRSLCRQLARLPQPFRLTPTGAALEEALRRADGEHLGVTRCGARELAWGTRTYVMGVLNVTPDSFSGDGVGADLQVALRRGRQQIEEGADILDVGGESTRPGSRPIDEEEELARVLPVIRTLAQETDVPISIDTYRASVAERCLDAGAAMINDVSGFSKDPDLPRVAAQRGVPLVVSHYRRFGESTYQDLVGEVVAELRANVERALDVGVAWENLLLDPGIGFGKKARHSLELLDRLAELKVFGRPLLVGTSRKSFIGQVLDLPVEERLEGTAASVALAIDRGADVVRVHDVRAMRRVARLTDAVVRRPRYGAGESD